ERGTMQEKTENRIQESEEINFRVFLLTPEFCFLTPVFCFLSPAFTSSFIVPTSSFYARLRGAISSPANSSDHAYLDRKTR
ncbi:MAG TPA: hypothetical protein VER76_15000, partial [Pyrinomonadaceae bacterium]|nr:hypothetical protein [Pyrinomonadaceae bacterium]